MWQDVKECFVWVSMQTKLVNKQFGTHHTTSQMFWASDTITKTLLGDKYRVNVNNHK